LKNISRYGEYEVMTLDRRRDLRIEEENQISFSVFSEEELHPHRKIAHCLTGNISRNGALIYTDTFLPVGTLLTLELSLGKPYNVITMVGEVRWIKSLPNDEEFEAGLEFIDIPPGGAVTLITYLLDQ
jgi:c-di-GMP-binding flagellar brake protein YcgR